MPWDSEGGIIRLPAGRMLQWSMRQKQAKRADHRAEDMSLRSGPVIVFKPDYVAMFSWGEIYTDADILGNAGVLHFTAKGDYASGWPVMNVKIDGSVIGSVTVDSGDWKTFILRHSLPAGKHELSLEFTNDYNRNGNDRNLYVDKTVISLSASADLNADGVVNILDLVLVGSRFGQPEDPMLAGVDANAVTGIEELMFVAGEFGSK